MADQPGQVILGVDTHAEVHVAAVLDHLGRLQATRSVPATQDGVQVIEVDRPNRQRRRRHGKSDPTDAEAAARAVLAGEATATPKTRSGIVEARPASPASGPGVYGLSGHGRGCW